MANIKITELTEYTTVATTDIKKLLKIHSKI